LQQLEELEENLQTTNGRLRCCTCIFLFFYSPE
jgi:hypothetical protein